MKELELLAPAGSLATLKAVIHAGADAVYVGGDLFGARAYADNFTKEELLEGIRYGHLHNRKIILAVNTLLKEQELQEQLYDYLLPYYEAGIDAVIVQDMGVLKCIREWFPKLPIHTSTQMTVTNADGAGLLKENGADRVVTAREMSLEEIRMIHEETGMEIESFIHGALCYCYSGQCLFSSILGGRSGNRGRCAQPCRLPYTVYDETGRRTGYENQPILSLKDMCTLPFLYELADSGIYSFKIEGRMKTAEYAAGVVSIYRKYMDAYLAGTRIAVDKKDIQTLLNLGNRNGFTKGYYDSWNDTDMLTGETSNHSKKDGQLQSAIREEYVENESKEKIKGKLKLYKDSSAMLQVEYKGYQITCEGGVVLKAQNRPLLHENVEEKMRKTGGTPFVFETFSIDMEQDVFLPVNQLNQLRRDALEQLEEQMLAPYKRTAAVRPQKQEKSDAAAASPDKPQVHVTVSDRAQLSAVLSQPFVDAVYLQSFLYRKDGWAAQIQEDAEKIRKCGKSVYYIFPTVFRRQTSFFYEKHIAELEMLRLDGYVIRSLDELGFLQKHGTEERFLVSDANLYTYSNASAGWFYDAGIGRDTIPLELNERDIRRRDNRHSEMILYGRTELMTSAQCIHKNTKGCSKQSGIMELEDRYHMKFPVRNNCIECYNIIYNSKPLCLFKEGEKIKQMNAAVYRLDFTVESPQETAHILALYQSFMTAEADMSQTQFLEDYTNGHFKRGVE